MQCHLLLVLQNTASTEPSHNHTLLLIELVACGALTGAVTHCYIKQSGISVMINIPLILLK
jgi:hypothetical protein